MPKGDDFFRPAPIFAPIRAHYARKQALAGFEAVRAASPAAHRTRAMEDAARAALAARIQEQVPELRENEALLRADEQLRKLWSATEAAHQEKVERASRHLRDVVAGRLPQDGPRAGSYEAGQEQARHEQERREATAGLFDGLKIIG